MHLKAYVLAPNSLTPCSPYPILFETHSFNSASNIYSHLMEWNKFRGEPFAIIVKMITRGNRSYPIWELYRIPKQPERIANQYAQGLIEENAEPVDLAELRKTLMLTDGKESSASQKDSKNKPTGDQKVTQHAVFKEVHESKELKDAIAKLKEATTIPRLKEVTAEIIKTVKFNDYEKSEFNRHYQTQKDFINEVAKKEAESEGESNDQD